MATERLWILGASDPEMAAIERLLLEAGEPIAYAQSGGVRVTTASAYQMDGFERPAACDEVAASMQTWYDTAYHVECGTARDRHLHRIGVHVVRIDHHRPGDPGHGRKPAEFLSASSIGQVIAELARLHLLLVGTPLTHVPTRWHSQVVAFAFRDWDGWGEAWAISDGTGWRRLPDELVHIAAADHCLAAAYRGACPGVDQDTLMRWRAESRAKFQRRPVADLLADVESARAALRAAPTLVLAPRSGHCAGPHCGCGERSYGSGDPHATTANGTGDCYCECDECQASTGPHYAADMRSQHVPELPEASAREGQCFVADGLPGHDGRIKVVCQSGTPAQIDAFMRIWAQANGLVDLYGDPARGFAGGYIATKQDVED